MFAKSVIALAPFMAMVAAQSDVAATFTEYGAGDQMGSANCANPVAGQALACGPTANQVSGYTAAISQNDYGAGPGDGAGPACGECWAITINKDSNGQAVPEQTIEVTINNLCPAQGNEEWCSISPGGTNQHGGTVHFDLCKDTGAAGAFFPSTTGAGAGTASKVTCGSTTGNGTAPGGGSPPTQPTTMSTATYPPSTPGSGSGGYTPPAGSGSSGSGSGGASPVVPGAGSSSPNPYSPYHRGGKHGHFPGFPYGPGGRNGQSGSGASAPGTSGSNEGESEGEDSGCDS